MDKYQVIGVGCAHVSLFVLKTFMCREELGLSARNIIIALVSSSLLLGLFLLFIFIGIGIFSDGTDPFAAIVNAGLTLSAGLGNFRFAFSAIFWRRCPFSFRLRTRSLLLLRFILSRVTTACCRSQQAQPKRQRKRQQFCI